MKVADQGTRNNQRYSIVPRTLCFLTHGDDVLLLTGAQDRRLWAGRLNGVGGHLEPDETPIEAACREVLEETGLSVPTLILRAIVHVSTGDMVAPGVLLFVFVGVAPSRDVRASAEGGLDWYPLADVLSPTSALRCRLVDDLPYLLPRILGPAQTGQLVYGHYAPDDSGVLSFRFAPQA